MWPTQPSTRSCLPLGWSQLRGAATVWEEWPPWLDGWWQDSPTPESSTGATCRTNKGRSEREHCSLIWVNVHSTDSLGRMCVPDGMQSVSRVCFFYRVNMDREQSSHHTRLYSNVHRVIHVYRYWPCSRHTSTCMRPGREVRNLKPFWLILGRKKGDTWPLQCLLLGVWIVH